MLTVPPTNWARSTTWFVPRAREPRKTNTSGSGWSTFLGDTTKPAAGSKNGAAEVMFRRHTGDQ